MPIPVQKEIRLPLLKLCGDEVEHSITEVIRILSDEFNLTDEEKDEWLPSGKERKFVNRVRWAKWDLKKAGLIEYTRRAHFKIAQKGKEFLSNNPTEISNENIRIFKKEFANSEDSTTTIIVGESVQTPDELIVNSFQVIEEEMITELLELIKSYSSNFFERLVVDLLLIMGFGRGSGDIGIVVGGSGDEGIDGIIFQDKLGLEKIYIQAKKWEDDVGRPDLQRFVGALAGKQAKKGVFITTSKFSGPAKDYADNNSQIVIVDGKRLAQLMLDHDIGVSTVDIYKRKKIDYDYFPDE